MPRLIVTAIFWVQWTLVTSLCLALLFLLRTQLVVELEWNLTFIRVILASVGAIGGAIKGGVLAWLLHQPRR